jgi:hypothetical protein
MSPHEGPEPVRCDRMAAQLFLRGLGGDAFTFQVFDDNSVRRDRNLARVLHGSLEQHFTILESLNSRGAGVFVTINRTDGRGRERHNIVSVRALFADLDGAPLAHVMRWMLRPHIVVESSPGRYHAYWLVDGTIALNEFSALQRKLAKLFGADPKASPIIK